GSAAFTGVVLIGKMHSALIFVGLMATYVGLGLTEEVFFYRRRREEERAAKAPSTTVLEAEGGAKSDEEVLEELGAFDGEDEDAAERDGDKAKGDGRSAAGPAGEDHLAPRRS